MDWLVEHAGPLGALCGSATAVWAFLAKLNNTYRDYLKNEFATKGDFHRLEAKIDAVLMSAMESIAR